MYSYRTTTPIEANLARLAELKQRLDSRGPLPRVWLGRTRRELEAEAVAASTSMEGVSVTVDEGIANNLDDHDGAQDDFSGTGTIKFTVGGFDRHWGNAINDIPSYTPMRVAK